MVAGNDISLISMYASFLALLEIKECKSWHYIAYRDGKIQGKTADLLMQINLKLPSSLHVTKYYVHDTDKYMSYKNNVHHWTTSYCWKTVIHDILRNFGIKFDMNLYKKVQYVWNDCDFSYHEPVQARHYLLYDYNANLQYTGGDVLRNINNCPFMELSLYHSLFRLAHKSGKIINGSLKTNRNLVVNCDSMAIPIVPVLAEFFDKILVIDNRQKKMKNCTQQIFSFLPTHYIAVFTEENFLYRLAYATNISI